MGKSLPVVVVAVVTVVAEVVVVAVVGMVADVVLAVIPVVVKSVFAVVVPKTYNIDDPSKFTEKNCGRIHTRVVTVCTVTVVVVVEGVVVNDTDGFQIVNCQTALPEKHSDQ